eukprot:750104_1
MQANAVPIIKITLKKSQTAKAQLVKLTQRAQNYIKPFTAKTESNPLVFSSVSKPDNLFNIQSSEIHNNNKTFDNVYRTTRPTDLRAYSISAPDYGVAGFVEDIEMDSIPYFKIPWNNLKNNSKDKINLERAELSSIYVLLNLYAHKFRGKRVEIYCDNISVIKMLNENKTVEIKSDLEPIVNKIAAICRENKINPYWSRIVGVPQIAADRLIRGIDDPFQYSSCKAMSKPDSMGLQHLNDIFNVW